LSTILEDGGGSGKRCKVSSDNKLETRSVTLTEYEEAALNGRAFNANTEILALTGTGESALIYLKNNESQDVSIQGFFVGVGALSGTTSDSVLVRAYLNPTGGTLITDENEVTVVNRDAGSAKSFDFDCYKGGDGKTITGQDPVPILYQFQGGSSRVFGTVNLVIPRGTSIAVTIDLNTTGGANVYTGFTGFLRNGE
jgi:hypothetical protein